MVVGWLSVAGVGWLGHLSAGTKESMPMLILHPPVIHLRCPNDTDDLFGNVQCKTFGRAGGETALLCFHL